MFPFNHHIALVVAACRHTLVEHRNDGDVAFPVLRVAHADAVHFKVRRRERQTAHVAAEINPAAPDGGLFQHRFGGLVDGPALCDAAEVDRHSRDGEADAPRVVIELYFIESADFFCFCDFRIGGESEAFPVESPDAHQRTDCRVERSAGKPVKAAGLPENLPEFR